MFARVLLLSALCVVPSVALKVEAPDYADQCPFGYGTNCGGGGQISSATRDQVANILGGILSKLSNHKDLVQVKGATVAVAKVAVSEQAAQKTAVMSSASMMCFRGLLNKLAGTKQAAAGTALARMLAPYTPADPGCAYFGACAAGSQGSMSAATKDQVAKILEGILGNLQSQK